MDPETALYMIPVAISDGNYKDYFPEINFEIIKTLRHFIVENVRSARRFLKKIDPAIEISELTFHELNNHTPEHEISSYLDSLRKGEAMGLMSEAGCPGVADPGASVARIAQSEGLRVIPLIGPSSILLSLMASGLNGQRFSFNGYLPVKDFERDKTIKHLEHQSRQNDMTQIFIETPYRNDKMMESLVKNLNGETLLCVAANVSHPQEEKIITRKIKDWKTQEFKLEKVPTIFLFYAMK